MARIQWFCRMSGSLGNQSLHFFFLQSRRVHLTPWGLAMKLWLITFSLGKRPGAFHPHWPPSWAGANHTLYWVCMKRIGSMKIEIIFMPCYRFWNMPTPNSTLADTGSITRRNQLPPHIFKYRSTLHPFFLDRRLSLFCNGWKPRKKNKQTLKIYFGFAELSCASYTLWACQWDFEIFKFL